MKLLLCLCFIFCFKVVFLQIKCYKCPITPLATKSYFRENNCTFLPNKSYICCVNSPFKCKFANRKKRANNISFFLQSHPLHSNTDSLNNSWMHNFFQNQFQNINKLQNNSQLQPFELPKFNLDLSFLTPKPPKVDAEESSSSVYYPALPSKLETRILRPPKSEEIPLADIRKHNNFKLLPLDEQCGKQENTDRIFSGEDTQLGEFPWLALLEYSFNGKNIGYKCGGVLINNKYVLTAAHCVVGKHLQPHENLFRVRLGEHDLFKVIDCDEDQYCSDPPLNLRVEEIILHGAYNTTDMNIYNDIALIRLNQNITFTDFVRPICLPLNGERTNPGKYMTVAGWGQMNEEIQSRIKQKADITYRDDNECKELWKGVVKINERQFCAGGKSIRNACKGDSGSPIMSISPKSQHWYVEGLVSFGRNSCGSEAFPSVYTRVSSYLTWILDNIKA